MAGFEDSSGGGNDEFDGAVFLLPLMQSVLYSFQRIAPGGRSEYVGLGRYEKVLTDPTFWSAVWNTVQLLLLSVPTTVSWCEPSTRPL